MMQTEWLSYMYKVAAEDILWNKILFSYSHRVLKFLINLRTNTLPSPDNIGRWNRSGSMTCGLYEANL